MELELAWLAAAVAAIALVFWFLAPYLDWWQAAGSPLEAHVARTSFQCAPGELFPPAWKAPELSLSVVVPAYNEALRLPQMLDETLAYLEARAAANPLTFSYEVIVVDDGSDDGTFAAAASRRGPSAASAGRRAGSGDLRVVQLSQNRGKGFAIKAGMLMARGQLLLMADADGATGIRDLERLEQALAVKEEEGGPQMAFGSRHHLREEALAQRSWLRSVMMLGFHLAVWLIVGGPVHDSQCGFKLFRARVAKHIFSSLHLHRWAFDIELLILARLFGARIAEVPITWVEMPGSKLSLVTGAATMLRDMVVVQTFYSLGIWQPTCAL